MDEFLNEMVLITGMRHRNLIKLKGCCVKGKERFLVYDFADNHDVDWFLLGQLIPNLLAHLQYMFMMIFLSKFLLL